MELTARKKQILKIVVESYIDTAEPLGSKAIAERMPEKVSSATVRNELAELSDMGYLEQPHTSAGRIPSPLGYRLYVNELMERKPISAEEAAQINDTLRQELKGTDQVIAKTGQMVSSFVDYPTYRRGGSHRRRHRTAVRADRRGQCVGDRSGDAVGQPGEKPPDAAESPAGGGDAAPDRAIC